MLPTQKLGRAALKRFYMWHCSTQGLPAIPVTRESRELLPHIFTLTLPLSIPINGREGTGCYFLWYCLFLPLLAKEASFNTR